MCPDSSHKTYNVKADQTHKGLFGMNVDVLADNPPWWYYADPATTIMVITSSACMGFKRYDVLFPIIPSPRAFSVGLVLTDHFLVGEAAQPEVCLALDQKD